MNTNKDRLTPAQQELVKKHLKLVDKVITKYITLNASRPDMDWNDLHQTGCLALCRASLSYDGERPFEPYAIRCIRNALTDQCRMANRQAACYLDEPVSEDGSTVKDFLASERVEDTGYQNLQISEAIRYLKEQQLQYGGVVQKGITCLIWKSLGYNSADLSRHFDVSANCVRAWMSHAAKKLRTEKQLYDLLS